MSSIPSLSLNSLLGSLSFSLTPHIHLTIFIYARWRATSFSFHTGQWCVYCDNLCSTNAMQKNWMVQLKTMQMSETDVETMSTHTHCSRINEYRELFKFGSMCQFSSHWECITWCLSQAPINWEGCGKQWKTATGTTSKALAVNMSQPSGRLWSYFVCWLNWV